MAEISQLAPAGIPGMTYGSFAGREPPVYVLPARARPEAIEEIIPGRYRPLSRMDFPPPQVLGISTCGAWSNPVDFDHCDEYRVTLEGPAALNPKIRIVLLFRERSS